jgi:YD repeat-containing protein
MIAETNELGHTTQRTYDAYGNLVAVTDPAGGTTQYLFGTQQSPISNLRSPISIPATASTGVSGPASCCGGAIPGSNAHGGNVFETVTFRLVYENRRLLVSGGKADYDGSCSTCFPLNCSAGDCQLGQPDCPPLNAEARSTRKAPSQAQHFDTSFFNSDFSSVWIMPPKFGIFTKIVVDQNGMSVTLRSIVKHVELAAACCFLFLMALTSIGIGVFFPQHALYSSLFLVMIVLTVFVFFITSVRASRVIAICDTSSSVIVIEGKDYLSLRDIPNVDICVFVEDGDTLLYSVTMHHREGQRDLILAQFDESSVRAVEDFFNQIMIPVRMIVAKEAEKMIRL